MLGNQSREYAEAGNCLGVTVRESTKIRQPKGEGLGLAHDASESWRLRQA
jgi:hypothetical protein